MEYLTALDAIISRGIDGARRDYKDSPHKRDGAVAGFQACYNKTPAELEALRAQAAETTKLIRPLVNDGQMSSQEYWKTRCYEAEIEWVCN